MSISIEGARRSFVSAQLTSPGALMLLVATVAAGFFFHVGILDLWENWQRPEYSHGPLIPLISGYLFLRQLKGVPPNNAEVTDRWAGVMVLFLALLVGLAGNIASIEKIVSLAIIIWVGGMILVSFGWSRGKQFWPPVLHLAFMMPLPFFLYWKTSIFLQGVSAEIGVDVIRMMGIPVFLDGKVIDLGTYKLLVAEACSGLRYMFPIMSFTYIFAVLYQGSIWHKATLLLAAVPIAILMNSIRIGIIGILVDNYGIGHAEGFLHLFEGWVIFLLCILAMIGLSKSMQMMSGDRRGLAEVLDVDTSGLGGQLARISDIRPSRALIAMSGVFAVAGLMWNPMSKIEPPWIERESFLVFPMQLGDWRSFHRQELPRDIAAVLQADDYLAANYINPNHRAPVDVFVAWYRDQSKAAIHSPEICIPGGGWEMSEIEQADVRFELLNMNGRQMVIPVNRAIIQKGLDTQLVYYWFDQAGRRLTSDIMAKAHLLISGLQTGRMDGALMRLLTPIHPNETIEDADARLRSMLAAVMPVMPQFIATDLDSD
ncbi:MAG: VPLPA-CTERM-specific exosortase XrtD [Pseudomonadota bacterium]